MKDIKITFKRFKNGNGALTTTFIKKMCWRTHCVDAHAYIHTYIHTYIQTDIHTYIHTFIHTDSVSVRLIDWYADVLMYESKLVTFPTVKCCSVHDCRAFTRACAMNLI